MDNLQTAVANIDETLQQLTNEEIDGQLAVVKVGTFSTFFRGIL